VLFLDELAEFDRPTLDALRQPLEEGVLMIARAHGHVRYPARFQLVAAMNPCRCGYANDPDMQCRCSTGDPDRYVRRVSGPLIDRLDIQIEMARVPVAELLDPAVLGVGLGVAMLSSAIPYSLELEALRRLPARVFGVLMSLEPAMATLAGFVVLGEVLGAREIAAVGLVVVASAGAARSAGAAPPARD